MSGFTFETEKKTGGAWALAYGTAIVI